MSAISNNMENNFSNNDTWDHCNGSIFLPVDVVRVPICFGIFGLFCSYLVYLQVRGANEGSGKVKEIGDEIHLGAMVFMAAEYKILSIFCVICCSN